MNSADSALKDPTNEVSPVAPVVQQQVASDSSDEEDDDDDDEDDITDIEEALDDDDGTFRIHYTFDLSFFSTQWEVLTLVDSWHNKMCELWTNKFIH